MIVLTVKNYVKNLKRQHMIWVKGPHHRKFTNRSLLPLVSLFLYSNQSQNNTIKTGALLPSHISILCKPYLLCLGYLTLEPN